MAIESYLDDHPVVDSSAYVHGDSTIIGKVKIGPEASIWPCAVLRGDDGEIVIGGQTSVQDGSVVHLTTGISSTLVGERVTIGHNVTLHGCIVDSDTIVGMGSILLDNCKIGKNVIIGAGTLISMNKEIPDGVLVMGNPFKIVRDLTEKDLQFIEFSWRWYVGKSKEYAARDAPHHS